MKILSEKHIFKYNKNIFHIVLIDKTAATSGEYLKAIKFRRPRVIKELKKKKLELGQLIQINNYFFIVGRKHYRSKWDKDLIKKGLKQLNNELQYKSLEEDYSDDIKILFKILNNFKLKQKYKWGDCD